MRALILLIVVTLAGCDATPIPSPDLACVPNTYPATDDAHCCSRWRDIAGTCTTPPDLAACDRPLTCGALNDPCCTDVHGYSFCERGLVCLQSLCVAPPPDMVPPPPDMTWRPDLVGGQCVPHCGACGKHSDCCQLETQDNCIGGICFGGGGGSCD